MNKNILTVILLLTVISTAQALIQPEKTEVSISPTEPFSIPVKIVNESGERALIHLSSDSVLNTEFAANDFYLNANEETNIALNIMPSHFGAYEVELKLNYADRTEYADLMVVIGNSEGTINLRYYKQNICWNKLDRLTLWIKNDSSVEKEVKLSAESTIFSPTIKPNFLELDAGEERFVQLELYSNRSFPINEEYSVVVNLETDDTIISREIFFDLTECIETERLFRVDLQTEHISLKKGEDRRVYFTVENLDEKDNEIFFAVKTDLKNELMQTKTVLSEGQKRTYWIELEALKTNTVGRHKVELFAFNPFYDVKKVFYVEVRGIHEIEVTLVSEVAEIERGASGIFTILVENKGDFEERIRTDFEEKENINVNIADESFYLEEKESKKIYVSVNPTVTAELGEQEIEVRVNGEEIYLNFKVTEGKSQRKTTGVIEFLSVPEKITLSEKETEIKVLIKNISGEKIENIVFWIESLPEGVVFESTTVGEIDKEKIKYVTGKLLLDSEAEKGSYNITLVVENSQFRQKKEIQLVIAEPEEQEKEKEKEKEQEGILAGLFSLGSSELIGLIVLVLIIIILLLNPGKERRLNRKRGNEK